ncbi:hypothetical protein V8E53_013836 [Lactarius tabidus]
MAVMHKSETAANKAANISSVHEDDPRLTSAGPCQENIAPGLQETLPAAGDLSINTLPIASNLEAMETQPEHNTEEIEPAISNIEKKGKEHHTVSLNNVIAAKAIVTQSASKWQATGRTVAALSKGNAGNDGNDEPENENSNEPKGGRNEEVPSIKLNKELVDLKDRCAGYERVIKDLEARCDMHEILWRCFGSKLYVFMFLKAHSWPLPAFLMSNNGSIHGNSQLSS